MILTRKAYKYRIYPTRGQISNLENQFSMCRHLYNRALGERINTYEQTGDTVTYRMQQNDLPAFKKERPWYKGVHSQALQDTLKRLDFAYQAFFRRAKTWKEQGGGKKPGFPKFKKRGQWSSITYPQYANYPASRIKVPKVGEIKIVYHREIPETATVKTLTISKDGCKWFACFSVELPLDVEPEQGLQNPIGIDLGLHDFLYDSDGFHVPAPKHLRRSLDKLARLQRRFAAEKERSPRSRRWYKLLWAIQKCHYKVRCQRKDFLHKTANALLEKSDMICHEDLLITNMVRRPKPVKGEDDQYLPNGASAKSGLNKSISDAGWGEFLSILRYKAAASGKTIVPVPPHFTSQKCSACGQTVKKAFSVRTHHCPCGFVANRDHNAAINILALGLESLAAKAA